MKALTPVKQKMIDDQSQQGFHSLRMQNHTGRVQPCGSRWTFHFNESRGLAEGKASMATAGKARSTEEDSR